MNRHGYIGAAMALIVIMGGLHFMARGITGTADIYYVHWAAYATFEPERAEAAFRDSKSVVPGYDVQYKSRDLAAFNYLILSATSYLGTRIFPDELVRPIVFGHGIALALAVAVFVFAMCRARSMIYAMGLAVAFYAVQGLLNGPGVTDHLLYYKSIKDVMNFFILVLSPGEAFSVLSFWPKSLVILLAGSALCLRSEGKLHMAYGVLIVAQFFHATLGVIFFVGFLIMDIALRRPRLSWRIVLPMLLVSASMFFRSQWQIFVASGHHGIFLAGLAIAIPLLFVAHPVIAPVFSRFRILTTDVLLIGAAAVIAIPASIVIFLLSNPDNPWAPVSVYLQLATRLLILAVFAGVLWLADAAVEWLRSRKALEVDGVVITIVCVMVSFAAVSGWWRNGKTIFTRLHNPSTSAQLEAYGLPYFLALEKLTAGGKGFSDRPLGTRVP